MLIKEILTYIKSNTIILDDRNIKSSEKELIDFLKRIDLNDLIRIEFLNLPSNQIIINSCMLYSFWRFYNGDSMIHYYDKNISWLDLNYDQRERILNHKIMLFS